VKLKERNGVAVDYIQRNCWKRHQLAHALWSWDEEDPTAIRAYSFRPKVEFDVEFDFNGLIQLGHKIGEISFALSFPGGKEDAWKSLVR
jgi:hypothetical protein